MITLIALTVIIGFLAFVINLGSIEVAHHQVQVAADAGALAAADQLAVSAGTATTAGVSLATSNAPAATTTVATPVGGDATKVQVTVTEPVQSLFSQFLGISRPHVTASAIAASDQNSAAVGDASITPDGCGGICNYVSPSIVGDGPWQVVFGNVDLQNCDGGTGIGCTLPNGYTSPEVVDLNGYNPGGIQQTISTISGAHYTLTFELTGNPFDGDDGYTFTGDVKIGSTTTPFSHMNPYPGVSYEEVTVPFVATSSLTTIEFYSTSNRSGEADYAGPEIADVAIEYPSTVLVQ